MDKSSSLLCCSISVSNKAIRLVLPIPEKYALDLVDLFDPSIISILLIGNLIFFDNALVDSFKLLFAAKVNKLIEEVKFSIWI